MESCPFLKGAKRLVKRRAAFPQNQETAEKQQSRFEQNKGR
jgi:hypothetical protein